MRGAAPELSHRVRETRVMRPEYHTQTERTINARHVFITRFNYFIEHEDTATFKEIDRNNPPLLWEFSL